MAWGTLNNIYGVVLCVVFVPFFVVFTILLHFKRHVPLVAKRGYFFLLLQNIGATAIFTLYALRLASKPHYPCALLMWADFLLFPLYPWPVLLRAWVFYFQYQSTQKRLLISRHRSASLMEDSADDTDQGFSLSSRPASIASSISYSSGADIIPITNSQALEDQKSSSAFEATTKSPLSDVSGDGSTQSSWQCSDASTLSTTNTSVSQFISPKYHFYRN
jgi:hypothetical protein